jgi:hypothetical protein
MLWAARVQAAGIRRRADLDRLKAAQQTLAISG